MRKSAEINTPIPDPTTLTTQQLEGAIGSLREIFEARLAGLRELHEEKFTSIETQFAERDTRVEQTSRDSKVAVDAALQAAKEAVGEQNKSNSLANAKMEMAFTKQIDGIVALMQTAAKGSDDKIDDVKTRLTTLETAKTVKTEGISTAGTIIMGAFVVLSSIASIAAVVISVTHP